MNGVRFIFTLFLVSLLSGVSSGEDHIVYVGTEDNPYIFSETNLVIAPGDNVTFIWTPGQPHNVAQVDSPTSNAFVANGDVVLKFYSGEHVDGATWILNSTFTQEEGILYYVCEPHAGTGMVGQITVGAGSADDPVQETIEDNEVPSVGFVVGSLVLVGAAGLRRRIH